LKEVEKYGHKVVINCCGVGAKELVGDAAVKPLYGTLIKISANTTEYDLSSFSPEDFKVRIDESDTNTLVYTVWHPNVLILGGTTLRYGDYSSTVIEQIIERCKNYDLHFNRFYEQNGEKLKKGLKYGSKDVRITTAARPSRESGIRFQTEDSEQGVKIIHLYGHGGSGWSLYYGFSLVVTEMVKEFVKEKTEMVVKDIKHNRCDGDQ